MNTTGMTRDMVGKRALVTDHPGRFEPDIHECLIVEMASSGAWVKLRWLSGVSHWYSSDEYSVVEVLES